MKDAIKRNLMIYFFGVAIGIVSMLISFPRVYRAGVEDGRCYPDSSLHYSMKLEHFKLDLR